MLTKVRNMINGRVSIHPFTPEYAVVHAFKQAYGAKALNGRNYANKNHAGEVFYREFIAVETRKGYENS